jgi:sugar/nucleoside kinase (ribokinase family)
VVPANQPTTFENIYRDGVRTQVLSGHAATLTPSHLPPEWEQARIVHLAPVAQEVSPAFIGCFPGALLAVTPQGWMRQWDSTGRVSFSRWADAPLVLGRLAAAVLSIEDVGGDEGVVEHLARDARLLVVTRGAAGSDLYQGGQRHHAPAPTVPERDPTGAGDIFAAAFFIRLEASGDPLEAARFATMLASASVTRAGPESIPTAAEIARALAS